ncbi:MAG: hypothetical protein LBL04_16905 [Bacteroidales bacterium]|jgi:hypothetical protein|nr:hypothetical protein [Bacteroidales bacterium]
MKNLLGCLLIVMSGFTACLGPMGPEGPPGKDATETQWTYVDFIVKENQWRLAGNPLEIGSYYYCVVDVPEITQDIYEEGLIFCNYRYIDDTGVDVQQTLPYTAYFMDVVNGSERPFSMHISYTTTPTVRTVSGTIEFRITFSDFYTGDKGPPASCNFRLTLVY